MILLRHVLTLACLLPLIANPAAAQEEEQTPDNNLQETINANEYESCMTLAQRTPEAAYGSAKTWADKGGGAAALQCGAVALINMDRPKDAAPMLERAGVLMATDKPKLAAELYGQAGQAWTMANDITRALNAQNEALALAPDNPDLLVDRAFTYRARDDFRSAIADLDKAHDLDPVRADVLTYRASAWRFLKDNAKALADADAALELDPENAEALLERGIVKRLTNDPEGARADWMQVVALAGGTPTGDAAKANLEKLNEKGP
jgi:tetratricopeptide (TPR) repeat protein